MAHLITTTFFTIHIDDNGTEHQFQYENNNLYHMLQHSPKICLHWCKGRECNILSIT